MLKTISTTELRAQIKRVLNEVGYGQAQYVVEKSGKPTAAIINLFTVSALIVFLLWFNRWSRASEGVTYA